jgi:hypothetical protein
MASFSTGALLDFRGPTKDIKTFKKYSPGIDGVCEYFENAEEYVINDLKASMYARGSDLVLVMDYLPGLQGFKGKQASARVTQWIVVTFAGSLISSMTSYFDKPELYNELDDGDLSDSNSSSFTQQSVSKARGAGATPTKQDVVDATFEGSLGSSPQQCAPLAPTLFATNATIDFRGPKKGDMFKKYTSGIYGICDFYGKTKGIGRAFSSRTSYERGDDVVSVLAYTPTSAQEQILEVQVARFDQGKISGIEVFFDKPSVVCCDSLALGMLYIICTNTT